MSAGNGDENQPAGSLLSGPRPATRLIPALYSRRPQRYRRPQNLPHLLYTAGGPELDRDDLWTHYRQTVTCAFVSPLTTAGLGGLQAEDIGLEGLKRAVVTLNNGRGDSEDALNIRSRPRAGA